MKDFQIHRDLLTTPSVAFFPGDLIEISLILEPSDVLIHNMPDDVKSCRLNMSKGQIGLIVKEIDDIPQLEGYFLVVLEGDRVYLHPNEMSVVEFGKETPDKAERDKILLEFFESQRRKHFTNSMKKTIKKMSSKNDLAAEKLPAETLSKLVSIADSIMEKMFQTF